MKTVRFVLTFSDLFSSDEHGDRPRPLPVVDELKSATDVFERKLPPAWAYQVCYFAVKACYAIQLELTVVFLMSNF